MKKEEHRTTEDDTDDDEGDKREHKKAVITSFHQFPPDGTAIPGPSASWYLFQFQKREEEEKN